MDLDDLIARLEGSTGPDRNLDEAIDRWKHKIEGEPGRILLPFGLVPYTSSIDAALKLVPIDGAWHVSIWSDGEVLVYREAWAAGPSRDDDGASDNSGKTPALALCIAALKAHKITAIAGTR